MKMPEGLNISGTITIESPQHLSDVIGAVSDRNQPILPVGGGTCLSTGLPVEHPFLALDMSGLSGIDNYVSTDMTASFQAGTPLKEVRTALAANGQELPIDLAADDAGTIGGLVATGFSGARRFGQGTLKDLIIGCEYVRGDGLLAKAGGMTVKNVSGFEISRLLHGSWGSLAVLTRVNLKVLPKARVDRTLVWRDNALISALDRQLRLLESWPGCIALQTKSMDGVFETAIRFVGREPAIDDYQTQLSSSEGEPDNVFADDTCWITGSAAESAPTLVAHNSVEKSRALALKLDGANGFGTLTISLPVGTVSTTIAPTEIPAADVAAVACGLWVIEGGDASWKQNAAIWGPVRADQSVAQSIKQQFDPAGVLNRGRLFV